MLSLRRIGPVVLLTVVGLAGCRQDMHDQPRYKPLAKSDFYPDMRSARLPVQGTVARGQLHEDTYFYTGLMGNSSTPGDYIPFPVTMDVLARGRERFNIYCSPCHSRLGDGQGIVPSRGFTINSAPRAHKYAAQIQPKDRWAIVAYIRALQLSQSATAAEIPAGQQVPSKPPVFREPGSGATLPVVDPKATSEGEQK